MDPELVLKGVDELKAGRYSLPKMLELAAELERDVARIGALASCVRDGSVYQPCRDENGVETPSKVHEVQDYAYLHYLLTTVYDSARELVKLSGDALDGSEERMGQDGHSQRFAELLRAHGLTKASVDGLGTFSVASKTVAFPPSKGREEADIATWNIELDRLRASDDKKDLVSLMEASSAMTEAFGRERSIKVPLTVKFKVWCKEHNLSYDAYKWSSFQKLCEELGDKVPEFITVKKREEVRMRVL